MIEKKRTEKFQAAVILFVLCLGVYPFLPAEAIDPWGVFNIRRFVLLLLLIGCVEFLGYLSTKLLGPKIGFPIAGFISGFVSSTAVFLTMPKRVAENPGITNSAASASILATVSTFCLLLFVIGAVSVPMLVKIAPPICVAIGIGLLAAFLLAKRETCSEDFPEPKNPLSFFRTLKLAGLLSGFTVLIAIVQNSFGDVGAQVTSFVAGLGELHGVSIASASMYANAQVSLEAAYSNILLAALASLLSKLVITWVLIRGRYALWVSFIIGLMLIGFIAIWVGR